MIIRSKQMEVFESAAEEDFVRRLTEHLLENYAKSIVRLPDLESAVDALPKETLDSLVRSSIERARRYDLSFESAISAFSAVMFEIAPNFDDHSVSRLCLNDANIEPNARLDELLKLLTEKHWEKIRTDYDVNRWLSSEENAIEAESNQSPENAVNSAFAATVMNVGNTEKSARPAPVGDSDFAETVMNIGTTKKPEKTPNDENFDFLDTVLNIDLTKE